MVYRIGTSGWSYRHWRGRFYPSDLPPWEWFRWYVREFATVELNVSFYRLPPRKRFEAWAAIAATHPDFVFAVKAPRTITHVRKLADVGEELTRFLETVQGLGCTLGPLLFQLPPSLVCNLERLRSFLSLLPSDYTFGIEFRHPSWFTPLVLDTVAEAGGTIVLAYGGLHPTPDDLPAIGPLVYFRVHSGLHDIGLTDEEIAQLAARLSGWSDRPGYVYFNNDAFGHAVEDARRLRAALQQCGIAVE